MEAKDTVMKPVEPCIGCPDIQVDNYGYFCDVACGKRAAWLNQIEGYRAGVREVVEWVNDTDILRMLSPRTRRRWQSKLKKWGVA